MPFPETSFTLIQRIAQSGQADDWRQFLRDYWGPVFWFAQRWGGLSHHDAEDVAGETFAAVISQNLLGRWVDHRAAKLRTLLCSVARRQVAARARRTAALTVAAHAGPGLELVAGDIPEGEGPSAEPTIAEIDLFYAAWADDQLALVMDALFLETHHEGQGDTFRVLYGRLCEGMTNLEIASALGQTESQIEHRFVTARLRMSARLEHLVRTNVERYCLEEHRGAEFASEWTRLGRYLTERGGLDDAVRAACVGMDPMIHPHQWRQAEPVLRLALERRNA